MMASKTCQCYECSDRRKQQRAAWEKTSKAKERQKRYRRRLRSRKRV